LYEGDVPFRIDVSVILEPSGEVTLQITPPRKTPIEKHWKASISYLSRTFVDHISGQPPVDLFSDVVLRLLAHMENSFLTSSVLDLVLVHPTWFTRDVRMRAFMYSAFSMKAKAMVHVHYYRDMIKCPYIPGHHAVNLQVNRLGLDAEFRDALLSFSMNGDVIHYVFANEPATDRETTRDIFCLYGDVLKRTRFGTGPDGLLFPVHTVSVDDCRALGCFLARCLLMDIRVDLRLSPLFLDLMKEDPAPVDLEGLITQMSPWLKPHMTPSTASPVPDEIACFRGPGPNSTIHSRVMLVASILFGDQFRSSTRVHFLSGFESVFPRARGRAYELLCSLLTCGEIADFFTVDDDFSTAQFVAHIQYGRGCDYACEQMRWLRRLYDEMTTEDRMGFFVYITGARFPSGSSWSSLTRAVTIDLQVSISTTYVGDLERDPLSLSLSVPKYPDIGMMREQLHMVSRGRATPPPP
jgi:hypothetical protein